MIERTKPPAPPSFLKSFGRYIESSIRHVINGLKIAPLHIQQERASICQSCEHNVNNTCTQCGCPTVPTLIGDKLARASESCPIGKWKKYQPNAVNFWTTVIDQDLIDDGWPSDWHQLKEFQLAFRQHLRQKLAKPPAYDPSRFSGQGILILGGGPRYGVGVYVSCKMARHLGWAGPIQVWHRGEEEALPAPLFSGLNVKLIDAYEMLKRYPCRRWGMDKWGDPANRWLSWGLKSYAALHCPFQEILYLDADAYLIDNPAKLFTNNPAGTVIWHDLPGMESNLRWEIYGVTPDNGRGWQGGQWLIDKRKCWHALNLYRWLDDWSDFTYRYGYGDQDNMRLAWAATGTPTHTYTYGGQTVPVQPKHNCLRAWGPDEGEFIIQHRVPDKEFHQNFSPPTSPLRIRDRWAYEDLVHEFANEYRAQTK